MRFSTFIFRNVLRRRIRSTLTMTGMAVAVTFVVVLVGLANGLQQVDAEACMSIAAFR